jgi:thiosulfate/3-mercaptopyruvate sulfurtransferase
VGAFVAEDHRFDIRDERCEDPTMTDRFLVSTEWLAERADRADVRVLDVSGFHDDRGNNLAHDEYLSEHVPGAVWFDVASTRGELSDPESTLSWTWPPLSQIEAAMGRVGVDNDTTVVLVARSFDRPLGLGTMWCTRAWWTLHHSGVRCVILEGGLERWCAEGRPTESGTVVVAPTTFTGDDRRHEAIADRHDVEAALADAAACVIDALPEASFTGERVNDARPGHITGASNVPFSNFIIEPTAAFIPNDEAREIFDRAGMLDRERVVLY